MLITAGEQTGPHAERLRQKHTTSLSQAGTHQPLGAELPQGANSDGQRNRPHTCQTDRQTTSSFCTQTNDGKVKSLYWFNPHLDQRWPQTQGASGWGSVHSQWGQLQQRPRASEGCGSNSTGPPVDRCPGGKTMVMMMVMKPAASVGFLSWMESSLAYTCPSCFPSLPAPEPCPTATRGTRVYCTWR